MSLLRSSCKISMPRVTIAVLLLFLSLHCPALADRDGQRDVSGNEDSAHGGDYNRRVIRIRGRTHTPRPRTTVDPLEALNRWSWTPTETRTMTTTTVVDDEEVPDPLATILRRINRTAPAVPRTSVQRIILVSHFSSSSSFVGRLLESAPGTFYLDEPLRVLSSKPLRLNDSVFDESARKLMRDLLRCNFDMYSPRHPLHDMPLVPHVRKNRFLRSLCDPRWRLCYRPEVVSSVCLGATVQVVRVLRLHVHQVQQMLRDTARVGPSKVLHLLRDPRAIIASSSRQASCKRSQCYRYDTLCSHLREDLKSYDDLKRVSPNRTFRIRYEDLALHPYKRTSELFYKLELPLSESVARYLRSRTAKSSGGHSRLRTLPSPFRWTKTLSFGYILKIQKACADVLDTLGYKTFSRSEDLRDRMPMRPIPEPISPRVERAGGLPLDSPV